MGAPAAAPSASSRWLYGRTSDLLLGCGVWYLLALVVFFAWGAEIRHGWGGVLVPMMMLLCGVPHHGATLVRVYEHGRDRRAYAFAAVWVTILVWGAFAVSVHSLLVGSWFLTIFLTWSPWHYTAQNYGICAMMLGRGGIRLDAASKRLLYATFLLSYGLAFLSMHGGGQATDFTPVSYPGYTYRFISLGIPHSDLVMSAVGGLYVLSLVAMTVRLSRLGALRAIGPGLVLMVSQGFWFSVPVLVRLWQLSTGMDAWQADPSYYFLWVGMAHAVQYLWVTSYYAKRSGDWKGQAPYLTKALLAGAAIWTVPTLVFAPGVLGSLPFNAGLGELVGAAVNLHHFVLDGAIWKLRSPSVARVLIAGDAQAGDGEDRTRRWLRPLVAVTGALSLAVMVVYTFESYFGVRIALAYDRLDRVETALARLSYIGRDSPQVRAALGEKLERAGNYTAAIAEYERAAELHTNPRAWRKIGQLEGALGDWQAALRAYERALGLEPDSPQVLAGIGEAWLELGDKERAEDALARAVALAPGREETHALLERARRRDAEGPAADRGSSSL